MKNLLTAMALIAAGCGSVVDSNSGDQPTITAVMPDHGPTPGGAMITLTGTKLQGGTAIVLVGGRVATDVTVASDTMLTFMLPEGDEGALVDVTVSNDNGFGTKAQSFTYNPIPRVLSISPKFGKSTGGSEITITGRGFQAFEAGMPTVKLAGSTGTNVTVVDDKTIKVTNAAAVQGTAAFTPTDVVVTNANGSSTLERVFSVTTPGILALERSGERRVFHVDIANGAVSVFGNYPRSLHGCAVNTNDNKLYCSIRQGSAGSINFLVNWDPLTGAVTNIGELKEGTTSRGVSSLVFVGNNLFGVNSSRGGPASPAATGRLAQINIATGAITLLGAASMGLSQENGVAIRDGANLWAVDRSDQTLDNIVIATGVLSAGPTLSGGSANDATVRGLMTIGSTVYLVDRSSPGGVFTVNTTTGVLTRFATLPAAASSAFPAPPSF